MFFHSKRFLLVYRDNDFIRVRMHCNYCLNQPLFFKTKTCLLFFPLNICVILKAVENVKVNALRNSINIILI